MYILSFMDYTVFMNGINNNKMTNIKSIRRNVIQSIEVLEHKWYRGFTTEIHAVMSFIEEGFAEQFKNVWDERQTIALDYCDKACGKYNCSKLEGCPLCKGTHEKLHQLLNDK